MGACRHDQDELRRAVRPAGLHSVDNGRSKEAHGSDALSPSLGCHGQVGGTLPEIQASRLSGDREPDAAARGSETVSRSTSEA